LPKSCVFDERSSLFCQSYNKEEKSFMTLSPGERADAEIEGQEAEEEEIQDTDHCSSIWTRFRERAGQRRRSNRPGQETTGHRRKDDGNVENFVP
jgi:hypothetical protein